MKQFILATCLALVSASAFADTPLLERSYKIKLQFGTAACSEPVPPNGHNYPVPTRLTFSLPTFDLWLSDIWTNVSDYSADAGYQPCASFGALLRPSPEQDLIGTVTQKTTESYHWNGARTTCLRATREDSNLLAGGVAFHGVKEFLVGPMDPKNCP